MGEEDFGVWHHPPGRSKAFRGLPYLPWAFLCPHRFSGLQNRAPEPRRSSLCYLGAFPLVWTRRSCLSPLLPWWELEMQLILQGPPLLLGSRDSWETDGCVCSHLGGVEDPPRLLWAQADQSVFSGEDAPREGADTILGEGICLPTPMTV